MVDSKVFRQRQLILITPQWMATLEQGSHFREDEVEQVLQKFSFDFSQRVDNKNR